MPAVPEALALPETDSGFRKAQLRRRNAAHFSRSLVGIQPRSSPSRLQCAAGKACASQAPMAQIREPTSAARSRCASDLMRPIGNRRLRG